MRVGIWYRVTKASDDETFEVGDHIRLCADGTIDCREAQGWIEAEDVPEAVIGMRCEIDKEQAAKLQAKILKLQGELNDLLHNNADPQVY